MGNKNKILILCGKSGSGKDWIQKLIIKNEKFKPIISWTSRPKRENETEGVEYHFCSKKEFEYMIKQNKLIEYRSYNTLLNGKEDTWYYGILKEDLDLENERYVVILDLNGAKSFMNYYGKENCHCVFVDASQTVRTERAKKRGSFDETEWNRRLKADEEDFEMHKVAEVIDKIVINNTYSSAEKVLKGVLYGY